MTVAIPMWRHGEIVDVAVRGKSFRKAEAGVPIDSERIFAVDTESVLKAGKLTTDLVPIAFEGSTTLLDHEEGGSPLLRFLGVVCARYGVPDERPSRTKQRPKDGTKRGRSGRRSAIPITLSVWFNLPYDISRLFPSPEHLRRIYAGFDSHRMRVSRRFEIEWCRYIDTSAPQFQWFIRDNEERVIVRLFGVDLTGYWKCSLDAALSAVELSGKLDVSEIEDMFDRSFETFSERERELRRSYAIRDADRTLALYHETVTLLRKVDANVVRKTGLIPPSAPGAAARLMFGKAFEIHEGLESWKRPPVWADKFGGEAYYGGRAFRASPPIVTSGMVTLDLKSAYPAVMTMLPDPVEARYELVEPCAFSLDRFAGKFGAVRVTGEALDHVYPACRIHEDDRLRYVAGGFRNMMMTIPEMVVGVVRGALRVDSVDDGVLIEGSPDRSFLQHFVLDLYAMKEEHGKSPLGQLAKLLMNSASGKLVEVNGTETAWENVMPVPDFDAHRPEIAASILDILVHDGGVESSDLWFGEDRQQARARRDAFSGRSKDCRHGIEVLDVYLGLLESFVHKKTETAIPLSTFLRQARTYRAGAFFMPVYGSQITGFVSAQLGAMASALSAWAGDTDSVHVHSVSNAGVARYHGWMAKAGYPHPRVEDAKSLIAGTTLGTWALETPSPSTESILVRPKRYSHRFVSETGEVTYKQATHGIARFTCPEAEEELRSGAGTKKEKLARARLLREAAMHEAMRAMVDGREVSYTTKKAPVKGRTALRGKEQAGEFLARRICVVNEPVPNTTVADGWTRWEPRV